MRSARSSSPQPKGGPLWILGNLPGVARHRENGGGGGEASGDPDEVDRLKTPP